MLRHMPYFEALAETEEDIPAWKSTSGGLLVLRAIDDWMYGGPEAIQRNRWGLHAVRLAVEEIDEGRPERAVLLGIIDMLATADEVDVDLLAPRLLAYARTLDFDGDWKLAADVLVTLIDYADPVDHSDIVGDAYMQLGYCRRMLGQLKEAEAAYETASRIARATKDTGKSLRVRIADAKLAMMRGNLPAAGEMLEEVIADAEVHGLEDVRAIALHDLGGVAYARGDYEGAVRSAFDSLEGTEDAATRDRVLSDIAAVFVQLGVRSAARDTLLVLASTAQEQSIRWASTINLMEIAALDGSELMFQQYRHELEGAVLPPDVAASFHFHVAQGCRLFGRSDAARTEFQRTIAVAAEHQVHQVQIQAEHALQDLERNLKFTPKRAATIPPSLRDVGNAIAEMRAIVMSEN